jgi:hypothetical protein
MQTALEELVTAYTKTLKNKAKQDLLIKVPTIIW